MGSDITVIVPIYNVEKYIKKCLDSLINQTYKNFEVWAVDDGSPDNSASIVKEYENKDSRIKLISKENGGYGSVLQYCIDRIKTDYFLICDPDDWLEKNALAVLHDSAEKNGLDIVVGDKYVVYNDNNEKKYVSSNEDNVNIKPNVVYSNLKKIQLFSFLLVSPHAKLYRTKVARAIKFPTHVSYTDYDLYILSLANVKRAEYINKALAFYLIDRPGNTATDKNVKIISYMVKVWNAAFEQLKKYNDIDVLWLRMYAELELILAEYGKVSKNLFQDEYIEEIYSIIFKLINYKKNISKVASHKLKFRILFYGLMNKKTYKFFSKLYVKIKFR